MKKFKVLLLALLPLSLCMCNPEVTSDQEKQIINCIYESLDLTPDQFAAKLGELNMHQVDQYESKSYSTKTFSNIAPNSVYYNFDNEVFVMMEYAKEKINNVIFWRRLPKSENVAARYRLFSDIMEKKSYTNWNGYYEDPVTDESNINRFMQGKYSELPTAKDREDLFNQINNDNLRNLSTIQYFAESFNYANKEISTWDGRIILYTTVNSTHNESAPDEKSKSIRLNFYLYRIK
jgi:hypothetical protein